MSTVFAYPCPTCRSTSNLHDPSCQFEGTDRAAIEKAYVDLLAVLSATSVTERELHQAIDGRWSAAHAAALDTLRREHRIAETDAGTFELLTPTERKERVAEPTHEPIRTIYEEGSVPGAHDNSVFALIAFYEMVGFTWEETREHVLQWFEESGTWDRGGFEESTPEHVVDTKRHVYEQGYGWMEKAQAAKRVIERRV